MSDELHDASYALSSERLAASSRRFGLRTAGCGADTWLSVGRLLVRNDGDETAGAAGGDDRDRVGRAALPG